MVAKTWSSMAAAAVFVVLVVMSGILSSTYAEEKEECEDVAGTCDLINKCLTGCREKAKSKGSLKYTGKCKHNLTPEQCCCTVHSG